VVEKKAGEERRREKERAEGRKEVEIDRKWLI
jgi:hypothetical protein